MMTPKGRMPMRHRTRLAALAALVLATVSCGDMARQGRSPVYLVINSLAGVGGTNNTMSSDVQKTAPAPCTQTVPCVFADFGVVSLSLASKDPSIAAPSTINAVTITRYHVEYVRADCQNRSLPCTLGVDLPYAFDSAVTGTIPATGATTLTFEIVRQDAKREAPLAQLIGNPQIVIAMMANVTFYGRDQAGNDISVTGSITIEFGNFGDA